MKKMLIILLSLGMVLGGCVQNEKPEEPPIVEDETEKQPVIDEEIIIDVESGNDDEETLPEEDEIDNVKDDESNLGDEIVEDPNNDNEQKGYVKKLDESKDWVYFQDGTIFESNSNINEWIAVLVNTETDIKEDFFINIDSEDAKKYNEIYMINPDNSNASGGLGYGSRESRWYIYEDILVILNKSYIGIYTTKVYMYDLFTGNQISLDDLLTKYGYTRETISDQATKKLVEKGYRIIERDEYVSGEKYFIADIFGPGHYPNYTTNIDENSIIYISPTGKLSLLVEIKQYKDNKNTYSLEIIEMK